MHPTFSLLFCVNLSLLQACSGGAACEPADKFVAYADLDGDGFGDDSQSGKVCSLRDGLATRGGDCDDRNPDANPLGVEVCNGVDDDCDGRADEFFVTQPFYRDGDEDGWGTADAPVLWACDPPQGFVRDDGDCNDGDPQIRPGAEEICNAIDDDCDGDVDEEDAGIDPALLTTYHRDLDGDGYGDLYAATNACFAPSGFVENGLDCADNYADANPDAQEICNGGDDDCDGLRDDEDPDVDPTTYRTWYADQDGDGLGDPMALAHACGQPLYHVSNDADCDDTDPYVLGATNWVLDADADGYGVDPVVATDCVAPDPTHVPREIGLDCDDTDAAVYPFATEVCNTVDDDCNGLADDADPNVDLDGTGTDFYADMDGDSYGHPDFVIRRCSLPDGASSNDLDCDDTMAEINPDAVEACNGIDDDCDALIDDADSFVDPLTLTVYYADTDGDGWGDLLNPVATCDPPPGYVFDPTDCDDTTATVGAPELWYVDVDGDGAGTTASVSGPSCASPGPGWARLGLGLDCDAADPLTYPGAPEVCGDGLDQDCNGIDDCMLFSEDWESGVVDALSWSSMTGDAGLVSTPAVGNWSINLGGDGGVLVTAPIDTSMCSGLSFRLLGKRGPEIPAFGDLTTVSWWDGASWVGLLNFSGVNVEDPDFLFGEYLIFDPAAFHPTFQVHFESVGDGPDTDDFYFDDIELICL